MSLSHWPGTLRSAERRDEVAYFDHAATSPLRPEVAEAMAPFAGERFGNPSGVHRRAREARRALEDAREQVGELLGCHPAEVVFTSGGTESDNLAVLGSLAARTGTDGPMAIVCSAVEHAAVLRTCEAAASAVARWMGIGAVELRIAPVKANGAVDLGALEQLLGPEVGLVSIMLANNEVGTIQPLGEIAALVRRLAPSAALHTDAVQAATFLDLAAAASDADLVSISAHKLGGPQGVGVLVVREGTPLRPIHHGGGQERERRAGTHNVAGAVGIASALAVAARVRSQEVPRVRALRDRLADGLLAAVPKCVASVPRDEALPGHCHLRFEGVEQEELLVLLDEAGICAAGGAACASGAIEPSHVLLAMGVSPDDARSSVRFSLGYTTTDQDVDRALEVVPAAVARLRDEG